MALTIGINTLPYTPGGQGGAEVWLANVLQALAEQPTPHRFVVFCNPSGAGRYAPPGWGEVVVPVPVGAGRIARVIAEQALLPLVVARRGVDCLFSNYVAPVLASCAQVVNIHDMLFRVHPEYIEWAKLVYWRALIPRTARAARVILTDSRHSARQIARFMPHAARKIRVTTAAVKRSLASITPAADALQRLGVRTPYVLSAGSFARHKNMPRLIDAFGRLATRRPDVSLVLIGSASRPDSIAHMARLREQTRATGLAERIRFTGFVSETDLAGLYGGASVFVLPSLFEGFGLPVLEAQHFGCPVVCSSAASLPEVAGDGARLVDPRDSAALASAIEQVIADDAERKRLVDLGRANLTRWTWEAAARDVVAACEDAVTRA